MAYESSLKRAGSVVANAVVSGTVSEIGGGKFANGAVTGAFAMMFNDMMHQGQKKIRDISKKGLVFTGKNKKLVRKEAYEFMIKRSKETGNEIAAAVLEDGNVIVFHDDNNDSHNSMMNVIAKDDPHYIVYKGTKHRVSSYVHTHPYYSTSSDNYLNISRKDNWFYNEIKEDIKVLMPDGRLWGTTPYANQYIYAIPW